MPTIIGNQPQSGGLCKYTISLDSRSVFFNTPCNEPYKNFLGARNVAINYTIKIIPVKL